MPNGFDVQQLPHQMEMPHHKAQPLAHPSQSGVVYQNGLPLPINGSFQSIVIMVNRNTPECLPYLHEVAVGVDRSCDDFGCSKALEDAFQILWSDVGVPSECAHYNPDPPEFATYCKKFQCSKFENQLKSKTNYLMSEREFVHYYSNS